MTTPQAAPIFTPHAAPSITNDALASQRKPSSIDPTLVLW
jgi:hypothetical protein